MIQQHILPRWRGFNLPDAVGMDSPGFFQEEDFEMIADLGFDFVRLPVNYRFWAGEDPFPFRRVIWLFWMMPSPGATDTVCM